MKAQHSPYSIDFAVYDFPKLKIDLMGKIWGYGQH